MGYHPNGKRNHPKRKGATKAAVKEKLTKLAKDLDKGIAASGDKTVSKVVNESCRRQAPPEPPRPRPTHPKGTATRPARDLPTDVPSGVPSEVPFRAPLGGHPSDTFAQVSAPPFGNPRSSLPAVVEVPSPSGKPSPSVEYALSVAAYKCA